MMTNRAQSSALRMRTRWLVAAVAVVAEITLPAFWMSWTRFNHRRSRRVTQ